MVKILFVCMGNICRSPTAEGMFRYHVKTAGLENKIEIDSAGTIGFHVGNPPDSRATAAAANRGINLSKQRSRMVNHNDFEYFDYIIAMDYENESDLINRCPNEHKDKVHLFLNFAQETNVKEVPDPYYGSGNGFETVLDLVEKASIGLLQHLKNKGDT